MSLTGIAIAEDRAAIIRQAKAAASTYYGETCVEVTLSNEKCDGEYIMGGGNAIVRTAVSYTADWEATVKHQMSQPSYGFAKCIYCKHEAGR